jgi:anhydro-N-acetylmuramic acid kinase
VDVAIVEISGRGVSMTAKLLRHHQRSYPPSLRREIFAFRGGEVQGNVLSRLAQVGREISLTYATAVNEALAGAGLAASKLAAVAAHGQTLFHDPPSTIQWFDPSLVAAEVGAAVVSDFRRADLAAGGQGAPLVPFADYTLFRHATKNRVLLNIGGIANITWLRAGRRLNEVLAFDTGPGNCISDHLCRKYDPNGKGYDVDGELAAKGKPDPGLISRVVADPYFMQPPPKSTDTPQMIRAFEAAMTTAKAREVEDLLATACALTGQTIMSAIDQFLPRRPDELIVSGGGAKNAAILKHLHGGTVLTSDQLGVPSEAKEAIAFALLGAATLDYEPSNVPSVTGARRPVVLGSVTPKP